LPLAVLSELRRRAELIVLAWRPALAAEVPPLFGGSFRLSQFRPLGFAGGPHLGELTISFSSVGGFIGRASAERDRARVVIEFVAELAYARLDVLLGLCPLSS